MQDPLADKAQDWTAYRYGFNNPMRFTDPTGMFEAGMMRAGKNASIQERSEGKDTQNMEGETDGLDEGRYQNLQNSVLGFLEIRGTEESNGSNSGNGLQAMAEAGFFSLGDNFDIIDHANNTASLTGTIVGGAQFAVGSIKNQSLWNISYKASKKLKSVGLNVQTRAIKHGAKTFLSNASRKITYVGAGLSILDVAIDGQLNASHVLNMTMVGVSAIPGIGWIAGGIYFAADMITLGYSGQSIGQHLDDYVGKPIVNDVYDW